MFENSFYGGAYQSAVPYYRPQPYAPQQMQQPVQRIPGMNPTDIISVNGRAGADAFRLDIPNSRVALFDANEDVFYIKATDGAGYPTVKAFRFSEITDLAPAQQTGEFVPRDEFDNFKKELKEALENVQQSVQRKAAVKVSAAADAE